MAAEEGPEVEVEEDLLEDFGGEGEYGCGCRCGCGCSGGFALVTGRGVASVVACGVAGSGAEYVAQFVCVTCAAGALPALVSGGGAAVPG